MLHSLISRHFVLSRVLLLFFWLCNTLTVFGQHSIKGVITGPAADTIVGGIIRLYDDSALQRPVALGVSDAVGAFHLAFPASADTAWMSIGYIGLASLDTMLLLNEWTDSNRLAIQLANATAALPEMVVSAKSQLFRIEGDTVHFNLALIRKGNERSVRELVAALPGLALDEGGVLTYQGRPIDRISINRSDVANSQLELIDAILRPAEIEAAYLVSSADSSDQLTERHALNLNVASSDFNRLTIDATGAPDVGFTGSLYGLSMRDKGWSHTTALKGGTLPIAGDEVGDVLRRNDFELLSLREQYEPFAPTTNLAPPIDLQNYASLGTARLQASGTNGKDSSRLSYTLYADHTDGVFDQTLWRFATEAGMAELETLTQVVDEKNQPRIDAQLKFIKQNRNGSAFKVFLGSDYRHRETQVTGQVSRLGTTDTLAYTLIENTRRAALTCWGTYPLSAHWQLSGYVATHHRAQGQSFDLTDTQPIFRIPAPSASLFRVAGNSQRNQQVLTLHGLTQFTKGKQIVKLGIHQRLDTYAEQGRLFTTPEFSPFNGEDTQRATLHSAYGETVYRLRRWRFIGRISLFEPRFTVTPPTVMWGDQLAVAYRPNNRTKASFHRTKNLVRYDDQLVWRLALPQDTRRLAQFGAQALPYSKRTSYYLNIKHIIPEHGLFLFGNLSYQVQDSALVAGLIQNNGFSTQVTQLTTQLTTLSYNLTANISTGNWKLRGRVMSISSTDQPSPTDLQQIKQLLIFAAADYRLTKWTFTGKVDYSWACYTINTDISNRFNRIEPTVDIRFRSAAKFSGLLQVGSYSTSTGLRQSLLTTRLDYQLTERLQLGLRGIDLLNRNILRRETADLTRGANSLSGRSYFPGYFAFSVRWRSA